MGFDVSFGHSFVIYGDYITEDIMDCLDGWIKEHFVSKFFGWKVEFNDEKCDNYIEISLDEKTRGCINDYIETLIIFVLI